MVGYLLAKKRYGTYLEGVRYLIELRFPYSGIHTARPFVGLRLHENPVCFLTVLVFWQYRMEEWKQLPLSVLHTTSKLWEVCAVRLLRMHADFTSTCVGIKRRGFLVFRAEIEPKSHLKKRFRRCCRAVVHCCYVRYACSLPMHTAFTSTCWRHCKYF